MLELNRIEDPPITPMTPPSSHPSRLLLSFAVLLGGCALATAQTTTTYPVSVPSSGTGIVEGDPIDMTPDARFIAFRSPSNTLVAGDTNNVADIFVRDMQTGVTERVSVTSSGAQSLGASGSPQITPDGRYVAFASIAPLVLADTNNRMDVYVRDRLLGTTTRVSVSSTGVQGDDNSGDDAGLTLDISDDGNRIVFQSFATNLVAGDTNADRDIFLHDVAAGTTEIVGISPTSPFASNDTPIISGDGNFVVFRVFPTAGPGNSGVLWRRDLTAGLSELVSVNMNGSQSNQLCWSPSITTDGRYVAFSTSTNDMLPGDANGSSDVFVRDMQAPLCEMVSLNNSGAQGSNGSDNCGISSDGRFVAFVSGADRWLPGDVSGKDLYVRDRQLSTLRCASIAPNGIQSPDTQIGLPSISTDGTSVCFTSAAMGQFFGGGGSERKAYLRVDTIPLPYTLFCPGTPTSCPCNPPFDAWAGCKGSGIGSILLGATITAIGNPSVSNDTIQLVATGFGANTPMLFFQGTAQINSGNGAPFGDGKRCIGGSVVRLAIKTANISISMGHDIGTDLPISVKGNIPPGGGTRHYQAWYRDPPVYCTPSTFNLSNGMTIVWQP